MTPHRVLLSPALLVLCVHSAGVVGQDSIKCDLNACTCEIVPDMMDWSPVLNATRSRIFRAEGAGARFFFSMCGELNVSDPAVLSGERPGPRALVRPDLF